MTYVTGRRGAPGPTLTGPTLLQTTTRGTPGLSHPARRTPLRLSRVSPEGTPPMATSVIPAQRRAETSAAARTVDASKIYGKGQTEVRALDGVTVEFAPARSPPSWARRARASRRCCTASPASTRSRRARPSSATPTSATLDDRELTLLRRDRVGFVFQAFNLIPTLTAPREHHACRCASPAASRDPAWIDQVDRAPSASPTGSTTGRPSCPAGSSSASPSPAPWPAGRRSSSPTSRPATSTRGPAPRCSRFMRQAVDELRPDDRHGHPRPDRRRATPTGSCSSPTAASSTRCATRPPTGARADEALRGVTGDAVRPPCKGLLAHKLRLFATALAVTLGVAFIAGTLVLTDTINRTFDNLFGDVYAGTDAVVRGRGSVRGPAERRSAARPGRRRARRARCAASTASRAAEGSVLRLRPPGRPRTARRSATPPTAPRRSGLTWSDNGRINPLVVTEGRAPRVGGRDRRSTRRAWRSPASPSATPHDRPRAGPARCRRRSSASSPSGTPTAIGGATMVVPSTRASRSSCSAEPGKWDEISVVADDGVSQQALTARLRRVLPAGVQAVTGNDRRPGEPADHRDALSFFTYFMEFFAVVALLVGAFMIFNTFSITVAQRTRENGAAACARRHPAAGARVGADRGTGRRRARVRRSASSRGSASPPGSRRCSTCWASASRPAALVFAPRTVVVALAAGILVTLFAAISPARKAGKVSPIAAMSSEAVGSVGYGSLSRIVVGSISLAVGARRHPHRTVRRRRPTRHCSSASAASPSSSACTCSAGPSRCR